VARGAARSERDAGALPRVIWITRAQPAAAATAERVRALGIEPIVEPLLAVQPIAGVAIDLAGAAAIVFTSANAVAAFAALSDERTLRVFAVGDATAAAARTHRFKSVLSTQGDVATLAAAMTARRRELDGVIVYPAAAEPSQDLAAALEPAGLKVRQTTVYETTAVAPSASLIARLPEIDAVLLHSAKAARTLAGVMKAAPAPHLIAYCLSRQVAAPLSRAGLAALRTAPAPNEPALLGLLTAS